MIDYLLSLLFPEHCAGCNTPGTSLCVNCHANIPASEPIPYGFALYSYTHPIVRKAIWEFKYHHKSSVAKALIAKSTLPVFDTANIVLLPIPQHYTKTLSRGFNQSKLIAKWIQYRIPRSAIASILKKVKATAPQSHTENKTQREKNLLGSMKVIQPINPDALYILIDDVFTTGSTIREATRTLQAGGAIHIYSLALAHGSLRR